MSEFSESTEEVPSSSSSVQMIRTADALEVMYCPHCKLPHEYCSYSVCYMDKCVPYMMDNCPDMLDEETLASLIDGCSVDDEGGKKKAKKGIGKKTASSGAAAETKVVIARIQRQKRKFVTAVAGLETVPNLKLKDVSKALGKKFASGASINEGATGGKEIVIQGDVSFDVPPFLASEFNVPIECIFMLQDKQLVPCG